MKEERTISPRNNARRGRKMIGRWVPLNESGVPEKSGPVRPRKKEGNEEGKRS